MSEQDIAEPKDNCSLRVLTSDAATCVCAAPRAVLVKLGLKFG